MKLTLKVIASAVIVSAFAATAFAGGSRSTGLSTAQGHVSNPTASGVLGNVSSGTPGNGAGFGSSVSGTANQNGVTSSSTGLTNSGGKGTPIGTHGH
jgi:hypothetical protein